MKICVSTANLGKIDPERILHAQQTLPSHWHVDYFGYTDDNLKPRELALHPRVQAKIPKMLAHELAPGYDYYIWLDGSIALSNSSSVSWLVERCANHDMALFRHPYRQRIEDEAEYCQAEMLSGNGYLIDRYRNEPLLEQVRLYLSDPGFKDENLFACGVFVYSRAIVASEHNIMKDWFYHTARYSVQDQLSLPYLLTRYRIKYNVIEENIFSNDYFSLVGHK